MEQGARIPLIRSAMPTRACREVPRRRQSLRLRPSRLWSQAILPFQ
jgi:hypothetical protein